MNTMEVVNLRTGMYIIFVLIFCLRCCRSAGPHKAGPGGSKQSWNQSSTLTSWLQEDPSSGYPCKRWHKFYCCSLIFPSEKMRILHILENQLRICTVSELKFTTLCNCGNLHSNTCEPDLEKRNAYSAFSQQHLYLLAV